MYYHYSKYTFIYAYDTRTPGFECLSATTVDLI